MYIDFDKNFYQEHKFMFSNGKFLDSASEMIEITNEIYHYNYLFSKKDRSVPSFI